MGLHPANSVLACLVLLSIVSLAALAGGVSLVETTTGNVLSGSVVGIASLIRLDCSPHESFDIPRSSILQMIIDFPRVVVETPTRVYIGPYSSFTGIDDILTVQQGDTKRDVSFAAVRAIALGGHSFHKVPRTWLEDGYLKLPTVLNLSSPIGPTEASVATQLSERIPSTQTWNELYQAPTIPQEEETPWWLLLLITAGLGVLVYLSL
ncbi:MAG TPA: hypothetical protein ENL23_06040 [Candidatus Acetothermia bacterium]|nr:hypothetical protein [Candidatus Acetothermia bacterium]